MPRSEIIPYITRWTGETDRPSAIVPARRGGIAYLDEAPHDRDRHGVLWSRSTARPGSGGPLYGSVHPLRQRRAMRLLLCQVCGRPADRNATGVLWLIERQAGELRANWPEEELTTHPPICRPCLDVAVRQCPHLAATGWALLHVREPLIDGVWGCRYRPGPLHPVPAECNVWLAGDPALPWVLASQSVATLRGCALVDDQAPAATGQAP